MVKAFVGRANYSMGDLHSKYHWYQSPATMDPKNSIRIHPLEDTLFDLQKAIEVLSKNWLWEKDMKSVNLSYYIKKCHYPLYKRRCCSLTHPQVTTFFYNYLETVIEPKSRVFSQQFLHFEITRVRPDLITK